MGNYQAYEKYKDSGVEWLGKIPDHWEAKRLKFVANVQPSNVDKKTNDDESFVLLCNYSDVYNNELITDEIEFMQATATQAEIKKFSIKKGDVIITKDSESPHDIAVPALVSQDFNNVLCGYHLTQIKQKNLDGKFLFRLFQCKQFNAQFIVSANGVTRFGLPQKAINDAFVTFPPLDEQESIANFLDRKTQQIDDLIAKKEALLTKLDEKRSTIISHAVTKGLDTTIPMKDSMVEWLGEIPEHWKVKRLKNIASCNDEALGENTPDDYEIEYVDISSVNLVSGITQYENIIFEKAPSRARRRVKDGDTIISTVRTYLKAIASIKDPPNNLIVSTGFAVIRPRNNINSDYIGYLLQSGGFIGEIVSYSSGVSYPAINASILISLPVVEPPQDEQEKIYKYLDQKTGEIDLQKAKVQEAIERLKEYRTALITNAVTGKIDVRQVSLN